VSTLIIQHPPGQANVCPLAEETVKIGRHPANDIVIDEIYVSAFHAEIRRAPDGGHHLVDLDSFNGTFVNGQRISRAPLEDGDTLVFALTQSKFNLHGEIDAGTAGSAWSAGVRVRQQSNGSQNGDGQPGPPAFMNPDAVPPAEPVPKQFGPGMILQFDADDAASDVESLDGPDGSAFFTEM